MNQKRIITTYIMNRCLKPSAVYSTIDYSKLHETASATYRCASCLTLLTRHQGADASGGLCITAALL